MINQPVVPVEGWMVAAATGIGSNQFFFLFLYSLSKENQEWSFAGWEFSGSRSESVCRWCIFFDSFRSGNWAVVRSQGLCRLIWLLSDVSFGSERGRHVGTQRRVLHDELLAFPTFHDRKRFEEFERRLSRGLSETRCFNVVMETDCQNVPRSLEDGGYRHKTEFQELEWFFGKDFMKRWRRTFKVVK